VRAVREARVRAGGIGTGAARRHERRTGRGGAAAPSPSGCSSRCVTAPRRCPEPSTGGTPRLRQDGAVAPPAAASDSLTRLVGAYASVVGCRVPGRATYGGRRPCTSLRRQLSGWTFTGRSAWRRLAPTSCSRNGRCPRTGRRSSGSCAVGLRRAAATRRARPVSGSTGTWSSRGSTARVVAPGLVPQRPGDRVKIDPRDARKLAWLLAGGLLKPIHVPRARSRGCARTLGRPRGRAPGSDARPAPAVEVLPAPRTAAADQRLTVTRRKWLSGLPAR
jgi:hypothetical protein